MNIYLKEFKDQLKPSIGWIFGSIFLIVASLMKYQALDTSTMQMNEFMETMPKAIRAMMGGANFDLTTSGGFFGMIFIFIITLASIYAAHLGSSCINKEELNHTSEFLFAKPSYRHHVLIMKSLSSLTHLMIFNGITFLVATVSLNQYENLTSPILLCMIFLISLELLFFSLGFVFNAITSNYRLAPQIAQSLVLVAYFIHTLLDMFENTEKFYFLTPYRYQSVAALITGSPLDGIPLLLTLIASFVLFVFGLIQFNKKDLTI